MQIDLEKTGKHFNKDWVFRKVNYTFKSGQTYAILGNNGSGKSTMLQVIAGIILPSKGDVHYHYKEEKLPPDKVFRYLSLATPYLEIIEEFTLFQHLNFHRKLKPFKNKLNNYQILDILGENFDAAKHINKYSSGMKQRLKLALAILSDTPLLLLDEPATNLDDEGIAWYQQLLNDFSNDRLIIICSNRHLEEYLICNHSLEMEDYK